MRLFIACHFSKEAQKEMERMREALRRHAEKGSFTRSENFHLTLAFLGETEKEKIENIKRCMAQSAGSAFEMKLQNIGRFSQREGNLYWMGVQAPKELYALRERLYHSLQSEGFFPDTRPFQPHVPLGRRIRPDIPLKSFNVRPIISQINSIFLMQSLRVNGILVYKEIWQTPLNSTEGKEQL